MKTIMPLHALTTMVHLEEFPAGTQSVAFSVLSLKDACYPWIQTSVIPLEYLPLSKLHQGLVIHNLLKIRCGLEDFEPSVGADHFINACTPILPSPL